VSAEENPTIFYSVVCGRNAVNIDVAARGKLSDSDCRYFPMRNALKYWYHMGICLEETFAHWQAELL